MHRERLSVSVRRPQSSVMMPDCTVPTTLRPVVASFLVFGFFAGGWAVRTVDIEGAFDTTDAGLGALLAAGIIAGTVVAAIGGAITDRWGAGRALTRAMVI